MSDLYSQEIAKAAGLKKSGNRKSTNTSANSWTDAQVKKLVFLYKRNYTYADIADFLSPVTRSAVAGKVWRLKKEGRL